MYSPQLGTFIERDPIEADVNLYRYCGNNPSMHVDPNGLAFTDGGYDFYGNEFGGFIENTKLGKDISIEIPGTKNRFILNQSVKKGNENYTTVIKFAPGKGNVFLVQVGRAWIKPYLGSARIATGEDWTGAGASNKDHMRGIANHIVGGDDNETMGWFVDITYDKKNTGYDPFYTYNQTNDQRKSSSYLSDTPKLASLTGNQFLEFIVGAYCQTADGGDSHWLGFMRWGVTREGGGVFYRFNDHAMYDPKATLTAPPEFAAALRRFIAVEKAGGRKWDPNVFDPSSI